MARVLVVDDDPSVLAFVARGLRDAGHDTVEAKNGDEAIAAAETQAPDLGVFDLRLPDTDGLALYQKIKKTRPRLLGIMLTGFGTPANAVDCVKNGMSDYLSKPVGLAELRDAVERVLAERGALPDGPGETFDGVVGQSAVMRKVFERTVDVARATYDVLILGETGTGKELVAQSVHKRSDRGDKPLEVVNCAAMTPTLVESHLFGHERGAFTDAKERSPGAFGRAHGGTIFLDEVGELPLDAQAKLLRALGEHEIAPVGGPARKVDVRVIMATNADLGAMVGERTFRKDLHGRLMRLTIQLPPLRDRTEDIPLLVAHLLPRVEAQVGKQVVGASDAAMRELQARPWPENIRELESVLFEAVLRTSGTVIELADLPDATFGLTMPTIRSGPNELVVPIEGLNLKKNRAAAIELLERHVVTRALAENDTLEAAARDLEVDLHTLYHLRHKLGLLRGRR